MRAIERRRMAEGEVDEAYASVREERGGVAVAGKGGGGSWGGQFGLTVVGRGAPR